MTIPIASLACGVALSGLIASGASSFALTDPAAKAYQRAYPVSSRIEFFSPAAYGGAHTLGKQPDKHAYKIVKTTQTMGTGGIDYVYADNDNRRLYVPRGNQVLVFDLDSLKTTGSITNARARGVAVDPKAQHGFSSSRPVVMWDATTLETIKTIEVQGRPDGILFEPLTERVYVFSHSEPNATVIDSKDGSVVGTIDLGGAPEQTASGCDER